MATIPEIIPITDLRQDSSSILKRIRSSRKPLIITQRGRAAAVLLSIEEYEKSERERRILRLLARGEKDILSGKGHDLSSVLEEADQILTRDKG
jgi:prevent-host-death family protein